MTKTLLIVNDPPYGTERAYNAFRLAATMLKRDPETEMRVFLVGDAASCAKKDQTVPQGFYNLEIMLRAVNRRGGTIGVCGTCMDARGIKDEELAEGTNRSSLDEWADWALWADKVIVF